MKLKIKETGEVLEDVKFIDTSLHKITIQFLDDGILRECTIKNLSDVEEIKDYEELKKGYYIELSCNNIGIYEDLCLPEKVSEKLKQIGNYFESKEEAEKAVEKLKAWKRLENKGFRFEGIRENYIGKATSFMRDGERYLHFNKSEDDEWLKENREDLDLLFGGEE